MRSGSLNTAVCGRCAVEDFQKIPVKERNIFNSPRAFDSEAVVAEEPILFSPVNADQGTPRSTDRPSPSRPLSFGSPVSVHR